MPDSNLISAKWENGKIADQRVEYYYNDGKIYFGAMKNSLMHGKGTLIYSIGQVYDEDLKMVFIMVMVVKQTTMGIIMENGIKD